MIYYLELKGQFEAQLSADLKFELLELHYAPYSFGSGMTAYRIKGRVVKIIFDGKDNIIELMISVKHLKYPQSDFTTIFSGNITDFLNNGLTELKTSLAL
jgi:hypothetical protein